MTTCEFLQKVIDGNETLYTKSEFTHVRKSPGELSKSTTVVLSCDTVFRLVIMRLRFVRYKTQMIEFRIYAFIFISLSRARPLTGPALSLALIF